MTDAGHPAPRRDTLTAVNRAIANDQPCQNIP
jgi:hypothetical protein